MSEQITDAAKAADEIAKIVTVYGSRFELEQIVQRAIDQQTAAIEQLLTAAIKDRDELFLTWVSDEPGRLGTILRAENAKLTSRVAELEAKEKGMIMAVSQFESQNAKLQADLAAVVKERNEAVMHSKQTVADLIQRDRELAEARERLAENELAFAGLRQDLREARQRAEKAEAELKEAHTAVDVLNRSYDNYCADLARLTSQHADEVATPTADRDALRARVGVMRDALECDALWCMDNTNPPSRLTAEWGPESGTLTAGPNNCRKFWELRKEALADDAGRPIAESPWKLIESAPKDGTDVLMGHPAWVGEGFYDSYVGAWKTDIEGRTLYHPTHWMPLPAAPTGAES